MNLQHNKEYMAASDLQIFRFSSGHPVLWNQLKFFNKRNSKIQALPHTIVSRTQISILQQVVQPRLLRWPNGLNVRLECNRCWFNPQPGHTTNFSKIFLHFSYIIFSIKKIVWRKSRLFRLLCSWERHLTGILHFYAADRW